MHDVLRDRLTTTARSALIAVFVDNPRLGFFACHQRADRSFHVHGRQFHICARCTGIVTGAAVAPLLLPLAAWLPLAAAAAVLALALDGYTQLRGWRTSTNGLRFSTGLAASSASLAALFTIAVRA